jgi:hypothetical protein
MANNYIFDAALLNNVLNNTNKLLNAANNTHNIKYGSTPATFIQVDSAYKQFKIYASSLPLKSAGTGGWKSTTNGGNGILYRTGVGYGVTFTQTPLVFLTFNGPSSRIILHANNVTATHFDLYAMKLDSKTWDNSELRHSINILVVGI